MKHRLIRTIRFILTILIVVLFVVPKAVYAQDVEPTPEVSTTEIVTPDESGTLPTEEATPENITEKAEPTEIVTEQTEPTLSPSETVETTSPTEQPLDPNLVSGVVDSLTTEGAVLLDENGNPVPLGTTLAAEALSSGDPWFLDNTDPTGMTIIVYLTDCSTWVRPEPFTAGTCIESPTPIQSAIDDNRSTGGTIFLNGNFSEPINISKPLSLDGNLSTTITAPSGSFGNNNALIYIHDTDGVTIQNLTLQGSDPAAKFNYAILIDQASVNIINNIIQDFGTGVRMTDNSAANPVTLNDNTIIDNKIGIYAVANGYNATNTISGSNNNIYNNSDYNAYITGVFAGLGRFQNGVHLEQNWWGVAEIPTSIVYGSKYFIYNGVEHDLADADPGSCTINWYDEGGIMVGYEECTYQGTLVRIHQHMTTVSQDFPLEAKMFSTLSNGMFYYSDALDQPATSANVDAFCTIVGFDGLYDGNAHGASGSCSGNGMLTVDLTTYTDAPGGPVNWSYTGGPGYNSQNGTVWVNIHQNIPQLSITNSPVIYSGQPQSAIVVSSEIGTFGNIKYDGNSTPPTAVGSYQVTADFTPADATNVNSLTGASAGVFEIKKRQADVLIGDLNPVYDGNAHSVSVSTTPPGLAYDVTYNGSVLAPKDAGIYPVVATIDDPNYEGSSTATLTIAPRPITVTADASSKVWTSTDPAVFTYQVTGSLVSGDTFTGALTRDPGDVPGNYAIRQGTLSLSPNYNLIFIGSLFNIYMTPGQMDSDTDGVKDAFDNCVYIANANQIDTDHDGIGDVCDTTALGQTSPLQIPVTGEGGFSDFNCTGLSVFRLPSGNFVVATADFCNMQGQLRAEEYLQLPKELPSSVNYLDGIEMVVLNDLTSVDMIPDPGQLTFALKLPEEMENKQISLYFWDVTMLEGLGDWVEIPVYAEDDNMEPIQFPLHTDDPVDGRLVLKGWKISESGWLEFSTNFPGLFVLAYH